MRTIPPGLLVLSTALFVVTATLRGADYEPGTPSTYLFDTCSSAGEPLSAAQLTGKSGWKIVPEDNVTHKFQGDVVLLNDRLTVVLRGKAPGAEVYCQTVGSPKQRAVLAPLGMSGSSAGNRPATRRFPANNGSGAAELLHSQNMLYAA